MVLPVRMWLSTTTGKAADVQFAHTFDITATGARLGSIRTPVQAGDTVVLQHGRDKARFQIIWVQQLGPHEIHAGVQCLEPDKNIWGLELSDNTTGAANKDSQELLLKLMKPSRK
jgi:hypothetical protein